MSDTHAIEMLAFETTAASPEAARAAEAALRDFAADQALPVIAAVFAEFDRPGERLAIDELLVSLPSHRLDPDEFARVLREALRQQLGEPPPFDPAPAQRKAAAGAVTLTIADMLHWLQHGWLPWHRGPLDPETLDAAIVDLVTSERAALLTAVATAADPLPIVQRIVRQWPLRARQALAAGVSSPAGMAGSSDSDSDSDAMIMALGRRQRPDNPWVRPEAAMVLVAALRFLSPAALRERLQRLQTDGGLADVAAALTLADWEALLAASDATPGARTGWLRELVAASHAATAHPARPGHDI
ncbi:MAG: Contractile injection system tape measure protein, partial [Pseudomonadota bacterium]